MFFELAAVLQRIAQIHRIVNRWRVYRESVVRVSVIHNSRTRSQTSTSFTAGAAGDTASAGVEIGMEDQRLVHPTVPTI